MAQSNNEQDEDSGRGNSAIHSIERMIREGRSFSGRERNCCFLNTGSEQAAAGRWANISAVSGFDFPDDGRALGTVDWDGDGDLDVWISNRNAPRLRFLRNDLRSLTGFLSIHLIGDGERTNRDAIGARVTVILEDREHSQQQKPQIKTVTAGDGFLSQSSKRLHFGLAKSDRIERIQVAWNGQGDERSVEVFRGLDPNQHYELKQGTGTAMRLDFDVRPLNIHPAATTRVAQSDVAQIRLAIPLPVPPIPYVPFHSSDLYPLQASRGKNLLVNLWSSQCRPCLQELTEFVQRAAEIRSADIEIIAISVDELNEEGSVSVAEEILAKLSFPFSSGRARRGTIAGLQQLHDFVVPLQRTLPLPSSFLIDKKGRLTTIYKGRLTVDSLLADAKSVVMAENGLKRASLLEGTTLSHAIVAATRRREGFRQRLQFADSLRNKAYYKQARELYEVALQSFPDSVPAHNNLGALFEREGRFQQAIKHYRDVLRIESGNASAHNNLGNVFRAAKQPDRAKQHYQQALQSNNQMFEAHNNLGILFFTENNLVQAKVHLDRARVTRPNSFEVNFNLAEVCVKLGQIDDAIRFFEHALQIRPNNVQTRNRLDEVRPDGVKGQ